MKRRDLLKACGTSWVMSAGLGITAASQTTAAKAAAGSSMLRQAVFSALVRQQFRLHHPDHGPLQLTLDQVLVPEMKPASPKLEQFSLVFLGARQPQLGNASYAVHHPALGYFPLHLIPNGINGAVASYRADFSLLL